MKSIIFEITGERPPNAQTYYAGGNYHVRAKFALYWHERIQKAMKDAKVKSALLANCTVALHAKMAAPVFDADNLAIKVVIDGMKRFQRVKKFGKWHQAENPRYLFTDDKYPFVIQTITSVIPATEDSMTIIVTGD